MLPFLPEGLFPVSATRGAVTDNGGITCDNISMKNALMIWIYVHGYHNTQHNNAFTPLLGTSVASCVTALPAVVPIWYGATSTTVSTLARQTDAVAFTVPDTATLEFHIIFEIDPQLGGSTYDCLGMAIGSAAHADNFVSAVYFILPRKAMAPSNRTATDYIVD